MIFGQLELTSATNEVLDAGNFARTVQQINVANNTAGALTFRIWIVKADETLANKHQYIYGASIGANDRAVFSDDIPLGLSDKIFVWASGAGLVAAVFGVLT